MHVKIVDNDEYEIVIGGWGNSISMIRKNGEEVCTLAKKDIVNRKKRINFSFSIENNFLNISKESELLFSYEIGNFEIKNIYFKTGYSSVGDLKYKETQNKGFYFMDTCEKNWKNYYQYYDNEEFENDVIIKCDDDIVFIDIPKLPNYINFIRENDFDLVFANTINNGVCAFFQQSHFGLIPKELMVLEYPTGYGGTLWESGNKAELLHNYFIENYEKFLDYKYNENIQINSRFSINFFGYKGKHWHRIRDCYTDDEPILTVQYLHRSFKNILYTDFYVSHLSFFKQVEMGININDLLEKYNNLLYKMEERFEPIHGASEIYEDV